MVKKTILIKFKDEEEIKQFYSELNYLKSLTFIKTYGELVKQIIIKENRRKVRKEL